MIVICPRYSSPAGLSATGDSDTRNYYDMISARQELDLRPQLERLDALLLRSAGVAPGSLSFAFRPLWQLSAAETAQVALQKAQTTAVYAGLNLWPVAVTSALVRSQLLEDGIYPGADAAFAAGGALGTDPIGARQTLDFDRNQARDPDGRWSAGGVGAWTAGTAGAPSSAANAQNEPVSTSTASEQTAMASLSATVAHSQPHAPDGTPIEFAGLRGKGRGSAIMAVLRGAAKLLGRLGRTLEHDEPEPLGVGGQERTSEPGPHAPPTLNLEKSPSERPGQARDPAIEQTPPGSPDGRDPYKGQSILFERSNLESKVKDYLLNPSHSQNRGKAKFFESNLDFDASNWEQLADQVQFDKNEAAFDRVDQYGNSYYNQRIKIVGTKGNEMILEGVFAIQNGVARLVTLLPD